MTAGHRRGAARRVAPAGLDEKLGLAFSADAPSFDCGTIPDMTIPEMPAAAGVTYRRNAADITNKAASYLRSNGGADEKLVLALNAGRIVGKGVSFPRWHLYPIIAVTTSAVRLLDRTGTEQLAALVLTDVLWGRTSTDGVLLELTRGRSLKLLVGGPSSEKILFGLLAAVAQALGAAAGDTPVAAQQPVLLRGEHRGGYGTGLTGGSSAVVALDGRTVSVLTSDDCFTRAVSELAGVQLGGAGAYTTGGGWFGGGFGIGGALEGAALASLMNGLTTRQHMDTLLRLVFPDAELTFAVVTHTPGQLELELAPLLAWLRGGSVPGGSALGLHTVAARQPATAPISEDVASSEQARFCPGCGRARGREDAFCSGCGKPY